MADDEDEPTKFALYKLFLTTAEKVTERRAAANTWMLSVNSAVASLYGYLSFGKASVDADQAGVWLWALPITGVLVCLCWMSLINSYRTLNQAKFKVIEDLEEDLPYRLYRKERHFYEKLGRTDLSKIERFIPGSFVVLYGLILGAALV